MEKNEMPIILCALLGALAFILGGIPSLFLIRITFNYLLGVLLSSMISGVLLGLFLQRRRVLRTALATIAGVSIGFIGSFLLIEGIGALLTEAGINMDGSILPDVSVITLMGLVMGSIFGAILFGKRSIPTFAIICALLCLPAGFMIVALNQQLSWTAPLIDIQQRIGFDMNLLVTLLAFGLGLGISICRWEKHSNE